MIAALGRLLGAIGFRRPVAHQREDILATSAVLRTVPLACKTPEDFQDLDDATEQEISALAAVDWRSEALDALDRARRAMAHAVPPWGSLASIEALHQMVVQDRLRENEDELLTHLNAITFEFMDRGAD